MLDLVGLGYRIAEIRASKGITQETIALELGIPRTAVSRLENGQRDISYAEMRRLAEVLGLNPDELAQVDRFAEKLAYYRRTKPELMTDGLEKVNEIIEMMLGYEQLYRRFGLGDNN